jgi:hypothetical protein
MAVGGCNDALKTPPADASLASDLALGTGGSGPPPMADALAAGDATPGMGGSGQGGSGPLVTGTGGQGAGGTQGNGGVGQGGTAPVGGGGAGGTATTATGTGGLQLGGSGAGTIGGSGGQSSGGRGGSPTGGAGGSTGGSGGQGGAGGSTGCPVLTQTKSSRTARSAGFTGDYKTDYYGLYSVSCTAVTECAAACVKAGGTQSSCAASECIHSTTDYCLPPTYWFDLDRLRVEGGTIETSAWIIMVSNPYRDQLIATDFQFEIPSGATIQGIVMSINRSADDATAIADYQVKLVREGATVGLDRAGTKAWPSAFEYADYGGPADAWGGTWKPADVNAAGFGVALTPMYLSTGGNARGYVDFIRGTVYYSLPCP